MNTRGLQRAGLLAIFWCAIACQQAPGAQVRPADSDLALRIDSSLDAAARFLLARQSEDGAWRSRCYGPLKDGPSLTPQILAGLRLSSLSDQKRLESIRRGRAYLSSLVNDDGRIEAALRFPIYTAAVASRVAALDSSDRHGLREQCAWIECLRAGQLNGALGWSESDACFGGWGYSVSPPRKPERGQSRNPPASSNVSATVFCLDALRGAGNRSDNPACVAALTFVERCQNFSEDLTASDTAFNDGGFFFTPGDGAWNKAGPAGIDSSGNARFHSYGAPTADGLRALLDCGLPPDHPRVLAARHWLESHFDATKVPGSFEPDREVLRNASYYYYAASLSQALQRLGIKTVRSQGGSVEWATVLTREILQRQKADGSWANEFTDAKEDDPLVATPQAMMALHACRQQLAANAVARQKSGSHRLGESDRH